MPELQKYMKVFFNPISLNLTLILIENFDSGSQIYNFMNSFYFIGTSEIQRLVIAGNVLKEYQ